MSTSSAAPTGQVSTGQVSAGQVSTGQVSAGQVSAGAIPANALTSEARIATPSALRYLGQLCKHFGHKVPSSLEGDHGWIGFDFGRCHLAATADELSLHNTAATAEDLQRLEEVIGSHLERFAFREELKVVWQRAAA